MIDGFYAVDYQVHSHHSHDGKATIREQCARAVELGLDELGFSEHKDFDLWDPVVEHFRYERYAADIEAARQEFAGRLAIRMGVEIDYQRWFEHLIGPYLDAHPFDFVIGSVHYVSRAMLMTPGFVRGRDARSCYRRYFDEVIDSVESGQIDILGHLEYANRRGVQVFGPYDPAPYQEQLADLFDRMVARGVALEINTAGLRQGVGLTYPCAQHVALYRQRGGALLSIGSDSHQPSDLADRYAEAARIALASGLGEVCTWRDRRPTCVPLRRVSEPPA